MSKKILCVCLAVLMLAFAVPVMAAEGDADPGLLDLLRYGQQ